MILGVANLVGLLWLLDSRRQQEQRTVGRLRAHEGWIDQLIHSAERQGAMDDAILSRLVGLEDFTVPGVQQLQNEVQRLAPAFVLGISRKRGDDDEEEKDDD